MKRYWPIFGGMLIISTCQAGKLDYSVETVQVFYRKEQIGDLVFELREDRINNGSAKKTYLIESKSVSGEKFAQRRAQAKVQREQVMDSVAQENRLAEQNNRYACLVQGTKKLISLHLNDIEHKLKRLSDFNECLEPFLAFDQCTFTDEHELRNVQAQLIPQARGLLKKADDEIDLAQLKKMATSLEKIPEKLENFFLASSDRAIKLSNDTRLLKDLLEVMS